ncbi:alpha/beta hydrolase [Mycolicibacterium sp. HS_4_1]
MTLSSTAPVETTVHQLTTHDRATIDGTLHTVRGSNTVVTIMHPRQDVTHHPIIPELVWQGYSVWTQTARSVNNDLTLQHEQALLDVAAGQCFLRDRGFESVITFGHSGGGALFAFYHQQACAAPHDRYASTPAGQPVDLAGATMPVPDAAVFLAPHPGQGKLLEQLIDPSVIDETDPLSVDPSLNAFEPINGFAAPPQSSSFTGEFIDHYRQAQRERVRRIDDLALALAQRSQSADDRRETLAPRIIPIYRTDADLRCIDLTIDPNDRPYGSLYSRRPDLSNYGLPGFARLCTPQSWLSTWSANYSRAGFVDCAPGVQAPTLFIELTGDQACFPRHADDMFKVVGALDKTHIRVRGRHFGGPIANGEPSGIDSAAAQLTPWLQARFPAAINGAPS